MKTLKVIVAGNREFTSMSIMRPVLDHMLAGIPTEIVCGMARGADTLGEQYAGFYGLPVEYFPAKWDIYGKKDAGRIRNNLMAEYADVLIAFDTSGAGTRHMVKTMGDLGKKVRLIECQEF